MYVARRQQTAEQQLAHALESGDAVDVVRQQQHSQETTGCAAAKQQQRQQRHCATAS
jgi:hypothetical protein